MKFDQAYSQLNQEQKAAVDHIYGPIMVVAGPGTGKTQLLSLRAANILKQTDVSAENILCLTFTNSAAINMSKRMQELIGPEAQKIKVRTFHSFASEFMANNSDYFFNAAKMSPAPEVTQVKLVEDILATLPLSNPLALKFAGQFTLVDDVIKSMDLAKEAGLSPAKLQAFTELNTAYLDAIEDEFVSGIPDRISKTKVDQIAEMVNELPDQDIQKFTKPFMPLSEVIKSSFEIAHQNFVESGKTTAISKWKSRWVSKVNGQLKLADERKRNAWWQALSDVYQTYRQSLHQMGHYDFSDMLLELIDKLENQPELLAKAQEDHQFVMIDEFQDTNDAQLRIAQLIADDASDLSNSNIMVVGDDDQSIYKFQGAELNNMLNFEKFYDGLKVVVLQQNYRSDQKILDAASEIINQAEYRLTTLDPKLVKDIQANQQFDSNIAVKSYQTENYEVIATAQEIAEHYKSSIKSTRAALARSHKSLVLLADELSKLDVPVSYERSENILELPVIEQTIWLLKLSDALFKEDENSASIAVSHLLLDDAWNIKATEYIKLAKSAKSSNWLAALEESHPELFEQLAGLVTLSTEPPAVVLEYVLGLRDDGLEQLAAKYLQQDKTSQFLVNISAVNRLRQYLNEIDIESSNSLEKFIEVLDFHINNTLSISNHIIYKTGENAVELMTTHKAKGLEFDQVWLIGATDSNWKPRNHGRKPPANLPLMRSGEDYDDYARLMFVAATRAKRDLFISYFRESPTGKEVLPSGFISNFESQAVDAEYETSVNAALADLRFITLSTNETRHIIDEMLENYRLSVTHLLNYLDLSRGGPEYFFKRNVLRIPEAKTESSAIGTAIHEALNYWQHKVNTTTVEIDDVKNAYQKELQKQHLTNTQYERSLDHGHKMIRQLFDLKDFDTITTGGQGEIPVKVAFGEVLLGGNLDHIHESDQEILITDFKTGKPLKNLFSKSQTEGIKAWRHRTQLVFYAMLLKHQRTLNKTVNAQMCYLESEFGSELYKKMQPSPEDIQRLEKLCTVIFRQIKKQDWPDISKYGDDLQSIQQFEEDLISLYS